LDPGFLPRSVGISAACVLFLLLAAFPVHAQEPEAVIVPDDQSDETTEPVAEGLVVPEAASAAVEPQVEVVEPAEDGVEPTTGEADTGIPVEEAEPQGLGGISKVFKTDKLKFSGYYWLHYGRMGSFALDETGARDGLNQALDHRLRVRPTILLSKNVQIVANLDVLAGQLAGDTSSVASDILLAPRSNKRFSSLSTLRELYLQWNSGVGVLRVGQMHSLWGLGLMANDGEDREDNFYDTRHGDRVERIQWIMKPAAYLSDSIFARGFHVALAGDLVFADDNASLTAGDKAWQAVGAAFFDGTVRLGYDMFAGVYVAYRNQKYNNGDSLEVTAVDVFTRHKVALDGENNALIVSGEGALIVGKTDAARFERAPGGVDLLGWGLVLRAELDMAQYGLAPSLEMGLASGDRDREDGTSRSFTFDPDYQAGMILFPEVLGRSTAWSAARMADPALMGTPPKGYDRAVTNGAITNALYIYPRLRYTPIKGFDIRLAFLWARSLVPLADPYNSSVRFGGYPRSFRNGKPSTDLGYEIDGALSYRTPNFWGPFSFRLGLAVGWCKPGAAFNDADGNGLGSIYKVRAMADLLF
jgi:hypothetical protein